MGRGNIVLIGMAYAGKTTIGELVAKKTGMRFINTDDLLCNYRNQTLQEIIDEIGFQEFLLLEEKILSVLDADNSIISTGGSVIYSDVIMMNLMSLGTIINLDITYETFKCRQVSIVGSNDNPKNRGIIYPAGISNDRELYDSRVPLYKKWGTRVNANGLIDDVVHAVYSHCLDCRQMIC